MAQKRFIKFKDPVNSLPLNERFVGIIPSAVYCGFDNVVNASGLTLELNHLTTGEEFTEQDGNVTDKRGAWITKQGVVIKEDANIPVTLETNTGNASIRIDYLVGRHLHDIIYVGGVAATYEIIKGPLNSYTAPTLTNPEDSVILGTFTIPAGATLASQVTWARTRVPALGNKHYAYIDEDNRFTAQQQMKQATGIVTIADNTIVEAGGHKGVLGAINTANSFLVEGYAELDLIPDKPEGTLLTLIFTEPCKINGFVDQLDGGILGLGTRFGYSTGLRPIVINYSNDAFLNITRDTPVQLLKVKTDVVFNGTTDPIFGDYWKVISVGDTALQLQALNTRLAAAESTVVDLEAEVLSVASKPFDIKEVYLPNPAIYFDITGLGLVDQMHNGWAICNGQNGTPNLKGRVTVSLDADDVDFNVVGATGGIKAEALTAGQMPAHSHSLTYKIGRSDDNESGSTGQYMKDAAITAGTNRGTGTTNTASVGASEEVSKLQPYFVTLKIMKLPA